MRCSVLTPVLLALIFISATSSINNRKSADHPEGFHFFKTIQLDNNSIATSANKVVQPLMLSKDHDYDFVLKNIKSNVLVVIKDDRGVVLASNYDEATNTYFSSLGFQAHITEFYSVELQSDEIQDAAQCVVYCKCH